MSAIPLAIVLTDNRMQSGNTIDPIYSLTLSRMHGTRKPLSAIAKARAMTIIKDFFIMSVNTTSQLGKPVSAKPMRARPPE